MQKRRKMRVKGGMDLRAYFVATKDSPKSRAMTVRANTGRMSASEKLYPLPPTPLYKRGEKGGFFPPTGDSRVKRPVMKNSREGE
jgi:hypothetical protein